MLHSVVVAFALSLAAQAVAQEGHQHGQGGTRSYAGEQAREIKSLSEADIAELRRGGGWGLAKPAELNGYPGPAHLLELKDAIPLEPSQVEAIQALFEMMRTQAIAEGERLVEREEQLDQAFGERTVTDAGLRQLLGEIEASRAALRYVHLSAHLAAVQLLGAAQIERYKILRGYAADPCAGVPTGHDPSMWRRHNGCE